MIDFTLLVGEAYAHVLKELCAKMDPKSQKYIFIVYGLDKLV